MPLAIQVVDRHEGHPWHHENKSWVTEVWNTQSHEHSKEVAKEAVKLGWHLWLVANGGTPSVVVYRRVER